MHYIDQFYSGLFPYTCFGTFKVPSSGVFSMLPDIHILKTKPQYIQYSVEQSLKSPFNSNNLHNKQNSYLECLFYFFTEMTMEYRNYASSCAK
jgi:hypothetical protein